MSVLRAKDGIWERRYRSEELRDGQDRQPAGHGGEGHRGQIRRREGDDALHAGIERDNADASQAAGGRQADQGEGETGEGMGGVKNRDSLSR
jgi:hypothetical protein